MNPIERWRGCLLGLAAGDALGTTLEFNPPGTFERLTGMSGGGPFGLKPGQWTDDTSMALCLADSLLACQGFDPADQMKRYVSWYQTGYNSSTGSCFDIGFTVQRALDRFLESGDPFSGPTDEHSAGNGSLMRLAPIPLYFADQPLLAIQYAADSSKTTHGALAAVDACRYYAGLIIGALMAKPKQELLIPSFSPILGLWKKAPLTSVIQAVANGSFKQKNPPAIKGSGYVVASLEAALWAFYHSSDFAEGALLAANLGDDADTTTAIYGQLAGAFYGESGIPQDWRQTVFDQARIRSTAERLYIFRACAAAGSNK